MGNENVRVYMLAMSMRLVLAIFIPSLVDDYVSVADKWCRGATLTSPVGGGGPFFGAFQAGTAR